MDNLKPAGYKPEQFFYSLTPDKILTAVEATGVRCSGRLLQLGSFENRVYEVEVEAQPGHTPKTKAELFRVVKFYRPGRWSLAQIAEEHAFLQALANEDIPVASPLPLLTANAAQEQTLGLVKQDDGHEGENDSSIFFAVFPKVQGRRPEELSDQELAMLGRLLARMHLVGKRSPAQHRLRLSTQSFGHASLAELQRSHFISPILFDRYSALVLAICQRTDALLAATEQQRIHGDCHLGNILNGAQGFCFLDFDDMLTGPVIQDLWLLCGGRDAESQRQRDVFLRGYEEFADFPHDSLRLIEPLRALRYVHYSAWIAKRWQDPIFPRTFAHCQSQDYWIQQLQDLEEVRDIMDSLGIF